MVQKAVTLIPGDSGRLMVSDFLPVIMESQDASNAQFGRNILSELVLDDYFGASYAQKYVRDFKTIRLSVGLRMGHTYAAIKLAKENDLIVEANSEYAEYARNQVSLGVDVIDRRTLVSPGSVLRKDYRTIWLLEFSMWPRTSLKKIREKLITSIEQRMIILG